MPSKWSHSLLQNNLSLTTPSYFFVFFLNSGLCHDVEKNKQFQKLILQEVRGSNLGKAKKNLRLII